MRDTGIGLCHRDGTPTTLERHLATSIISGPFRSAAHVDGCAVHGIAVPAARTAVPHAARTNIVVVVFFGIVIIIFRIIAEGHAVFILITDVGSD